MCVCCPPSLHDWKTYPPTGLLAAIVCVDPVCQLNICGVVIGYRQLERIPGPRGSNLTVILVVPGGGGGGVSMFTWIIGVQPLPLSAYM